MLFRIFLLFFLLHLCSFIRSISFFIALNAYTFWYTITPWYGTFILLYPRGILPIVRFFLTYSKTGVAFSGIALTVTCDAQVRFGLSWQPCNCYLLPVNGLGKKLPPRGRGALAVEGACGIYDKCSPYQSKRFCSACSLSRLRHQLPPGVSLWHKNILR